MAPIKKHQRFEKGQSLVEFAFGVVFMVYLLTGIVDLGRAFFSYMTLRDAVQEGALYASLHPTNTGGISSRVVGVADGPLDMSLISVAHSFPSGAACTGNPVTVEATYQFTISMPFLGTVIGAQSFPLKASVTDYILSPPCS